jgi:hypothetical protein
MVPISKGLSLAFMLLSLSMAHAMNSGSDKSEEMESIQERPTEEDQNFENDFLSTGKDDKAPSATLTKPQGKFVKQKDTA